MFEKRFENKVFIVTGAGSGIGAATAKRVSSERATVVLAGRTKEKLTQVASVLDHERSLAQVTDVSVFADVKSLIGETVARFGRIDALVNSAGICVPGGFLDQGIDDWNRHVRVNVDGVLNTIHAALPHLIQSKGSIVNVSSVSGLGGDRKMSLYNASKGAVSNLTRSLAIEFGEQGVRINAVNPSVTLTEMNIPFFNTVPGALENQLTRIPLERAAQPEEVASVIAFLASKDASFINGVNLPVDGGVTATSGQAHFL